MLESLADEVQKALQFAGEEAVRAAAPVAVGAAFAGATGVVRVITGKFRFLPADPQAATAKILRYAENDAEFEYQLYAAMAVRKTRGKEVIIPPGPPGFEDRTDLLPRLGEPGTYLVTGPPGRGKTYLVRQVSHDRATEYADGNCYIDCKLFRVDGALRYAEIFSEVLRQIGVDVVEISDAALSTQYERALLHGRFLLVFENVDSAAEAQALARHWPFSLVLLTTQNATGELAAWCPTLPVALGGLDQAGARALLGSGGRASVLDAEPEATEQLLDICDNIPTFLWRAGDALSQRQREYRPVVRLLAELRAGDDPRGFDGVLTGLGLSGLSASVRDDLAVLSIHPGETFTRDSARALLGRAAGATIDTLLAAGLAVDDFGGHFRLLQLVRQRVTPPPVVAEAAWDRLLAVVDEQAAAADETMEGDRLRPAVLLTGLPWLLPHLTPIEYLDVHATLIVELVELAHHRKQYQVAVRLCGALEVVLTYRGRPHLIATGITWGIESAKELKDATAIARLYATRARIETHLGQFDKAAKSLDVAERWARKAHNPRLDSSLLEFRARLARERARHAIDAGAPETVNAFAEATAFIRQSLEIDRAHDLHRARGIHARELGNLMVRARQPAEAMLLFDEAALYTADTQIRNLSRIHLGRARAYDLLEQWPDVDREVALARTLTAASGANAYDEELDDFVAETAAHRGDFETARTQWNGLAEKFYAMGHPRYDRYKEKLSQLPPTHEGR